MTPDAIWINCPTCASTYRAPVKVIDNDKAGHLTLALQTHTCPQMIDITINAGTHHE